MIILDTNVISATLQRNPDARVIAWLDAQPMEWLYLTTVTATELLFGIAVLPNGRRKRDLQSVIDALLAASAPRMLPFDISAARHHAELAARARAKGRAFPWADGYIAAIAAAHDFAVATRDVGPFLAAGVRVMNPWDE